MPRNLHFFLLECSPVRETMEQIGENAILMHFHAIVTDICSSGGPENILTSNYR